MAEPRVLKLSEAELTPDAQSAVAVGTCRRMIRNEALSTYLCHEYGQPDLCLKVLRLPGDQWERQPLRDVSRVQNLGAMHDVAPRVFDVVKLPDGHVAQVTQWAGTHAEPSIQGIARLMQVIACYEIRTGKWIDESRRPKWDIVVSIRNWAGDWFLDWGGLYVVDSSTLPNADWARFR